MEDLENLLYEYLLVPKHVPESEKGAAREEMRKSFENLKNMLLNEETWNIFLADQYDIGTLKTKLNSKSDEERSDIFMFGMSCLITFTQANFTGPDLCEKVENFLKKDMFQNLDFNKMLSYNNEEINCQTKYPQLLVTAKIIFEWCIVNSIVNIWWYWRALYLHQHVLDELSPSLLSDADRLYKLLQVNFSPKESIKAALDIEVAQLYILFRHVGKAKEHINSAVEALNLKYDFVGILGKRTKFQEKAVAQLAIKVNINDEIMAGISVVPPVTDTDTILSTDESEFPKDLPLNDDVILDNVELQADVNENVVLSNLPQKLFLTVVQEVLIAKPSSDLENESMLPFLELILGQKNTFCVKVVALLLRSRLESKSQRTVERSLRQCEEVLDAFKKEKPEPFDRFIDVFGCGLQASWKINNQYADLLLNIGLPKNALDIYLNLQLWEEVIVCYTLLKLRHKAAEIITQQLEIKPTVKLWCLLGDATDDVSCYEKAWELSKRRSHRAQRHWGNFLYNHENYAECIPHFEKSVSINPLQASVWFRLGFAAHKTDNWQVAATAYKRYTTLEPDSFEAWNNLAQAYLKIGNKRSAHQALLEALKCNYDNWKVWENFLVVSSDISMYSDVIRSYHRLLDLKEKYLNVNVLGELVCDVIDDTIDCEGLPAARFLQKTRELLGRVVSIHPGEGPVWDLYAKLAPNIVLKTQRLQRAFKAYTRDNQWFKDLKICNQVLYLCFELGDIALMPEVEPKNPVVHSIKLNITAAMSAIRKEDFLDNKEPLDRLCIITGRILQKIHGGK
ncbi:tetratricopeptide repeat protein 27 [Anthonomus grandis grandis]|uniref:tetratricopeptide repeat protein 27 n=1 Tax=Anthonomus grandis grandis TaxID=2921223 RepID=UPI002165E2B0|nr:tetratricopeptide repeat protein 27 [Anthonomus grandis grandis]XP_050294804.1 tetratricopeptide repeat protein 27 [Anthonomus grandis grandis]XP_050294806.1 tetratricopeptide repeat protein 27 [Anthonomus grandis grandis]